MFALNTKNNIMFALTKDKKFRTKQGEWVTLARHQEIEWTVWISASQKAHKLDAKIISAVTLLGQILDSRYDNGVVGGICEPAVEEIPLGTSSEYFNPQD